MNNTTTNNQLATVTKSIVPPPKKKDVIEATATALFEDHQKKIPLMEEALEKQIGLVHQMVKRAFAKNRKQFEADFRFYDYDGAVVKFEAHKDAFPEIRREKDKANDMEKAIRKAKTKSRWDFVLELRKANGIQVNHTVNSLLSDPQIKGRLLRAGLALLAKPTAEDKAKAITA